LGVGVDGRSRHIGNHLRKCFPGDSHANVLAGVKEQERESSPGKVQSKLPEVEPKSDEEQMEGEVSEKGVPKEN